MSLTSFSFVTLVFANSTLGEALAAELGDSVLFAKTNVTKEKDVSDMIKAGVEKFGGIHGVINSAGVGFPKRVLSGKSARVHPLSHFKTVVDINLFGTFNVLSK